MMAQYHETQGNIFDDLGFDRAEAANLKIRAELMHELTLHIQESGLSQAQIAKQLGVAQPRVSDLMNGKINKFTIDMLVKMLHRFRVGVYLNVNCTHQHTDNNSLGHTHARS